MGFSLRRRGALSCGSLRIFVCHSKTAAIHWGAVSAWERCNKQGPGQTRETAVVSARLRLLSAANRAVMVTVIHSRRKERTWPKRCLPQSKNCGVLNVSALRNKYQEIFGEESRSSNKQFLYRRIAWRLQANAEGGLSERARHRAAHIVEDADLRTRAPREFLPAQVPVDVEENSVPAT